MSDSVHELRKACHCLYLAVDPSSIADDVKAKAESVITELATVRRQLAEREAEVSRLTNSLTTAIENYELAKQSRDTLQANLDRVRKGQTCKMRNGNTARILATDLSFGLYQIIGVVKHSVGNSEVLYWEKDGRSIRVFNRDLDLEPVELATLLSDAAEREE